MRNPSSQISQSDNSSLYQKGGSKRTSEQANKRTSGQANKRTDKQADKKKNEHEYAIRAILEENGDCTSGEIASKLSLSQQRVRAILAKMEGIETVGRTNTRRYRLKETGGVNGKKNM